MACTPAKTWNWDGEGPMGEYRFDDSGIQALRRRLIGMMVVYGVIIVAVVVIVNLASNAMQGSALVVAVIVGVVIAATLGFMTWRTLGAQTARWRAIRLRVGEDWIEREDPPAAPVRIERSAIGLVQETGGGILIKTTGDRREIAVPRLIGLQPYGELRDRLSTWKPVEPMPPARQYGGLLILIPILVAMGLVFFTTNPALIAIGVLGLMAINGYQVVQLRRTPGTNPQLQRSLLISMGLMFFVGLCRIVSLMMFPPG